MALQSLSIQLTQSPLLPPTPSRSNRSNILRTSVTPNMPPWMLAFLSCAFFPNAASSSFLKSGQVSVCSALVNIFASEDVWAQVEVGTVVLCSRMMESARFWSAGLS